MQVVSLEDETPSATRRRHSAVQQNFTSSHVERSSLVMNRRKTSIFQESHPPKASIVGQRASVISKYFALPSTADPFKQYGIRPTLINAMLYFTDPNPSVEKLRDILADRLLILPRFRSVFSYDEKMNEVHWDPISKSEVDMEYHVQLIDGNNEFQDEDVRELVSDSYLCDWDTTKPLWRMTLFSNLKDGRSMLFCSIDHAIGDGVAMLQVMLSLLDDSQKKATTSHKKRQKDITQRRWSHKMLNFVLGIKTGFADMMLPFKDPPNSIKISDEKRFVKPIGKVFCQTKAFDLSELKSMKSKLKGTTVNDVIMALHTIALHDYFTKTKEIALLEKATRGDVKIHGEFLVNVRPQNSPLSDLGNKIVLGLFTFPLAFRNPIDAVWQCKQQADFLKSSPYFIVKKVMTDLVFSILPAKQIADAIIQGSGSTLMISNVMGPQEEATMASYAIDDLNFTATVSNGLYCGILSYNQKVRISLIMDKLSDGDAWLLKECLEKAYDDLKEAVSKEAPGDEDLIEPPVVKVPIFARIWEILVGIMMFSIPILVARAYCVD